MTKTNKRLNQLLILMIGIFIGIPFLYYFYLQIQASTQQLNIMDIIEQNPVLSIQLIASCLLPYNGYLLYKMRQDITNYENGPKIYLNISCLFIAQIIMGNTLYAGLFAWLLFSIHRMYQLNCSEIKDFISIKNLFNKVGGAIIIIFIAIMIRLMMDAIS